jgi:Zn-dependent M28 family amino/carboxypeptidase
MHKRLFFAIALTTGLGLAATNWDAAGKEWWAHVQYLASDDLQGRDVGSPGFDKAANYVAGEFEKAGLKPGNGSSYFQPVAFESVVIEPRRSSLSLVHNGVATSVSVPAEALLGYSGHAAATIEAPLVFAGYGLSIPEAHWDDLKGLRVHGAVVVYLAGGPESISGNLRSHYSSNAERWRALRSAGAVGTISIQNPKTMEIPWSRTSLNWGRPVMSLADPSMDESVGRLFSATWDPAKADDLFTGSGHTFAEILNAADKQQPLPHFEIPASIKASVATSKRAIDSKNIVGIRLGDDPQLKNKFVVISAHLDHLGVGKPVNGDSIFNGAMDDASGDASLIEIAKALGHSHTPIHRSLLFLSVTGEEKGELGSRYFAEHPTVKGRIVADLNMDMYLPLFPLKWLEVQGLQESSLGSDIRVVAEAAGVRVQADKEPNHNRFIRSDQYSFIKKGVPSLAFKFGYIPGGPEEKIFKDWYTNRYHAVSDDINQPVDKAAAAQFNEILKNLAVRVADASSDPAWNSSSFFKRFATKAN